MPNLLFQDNTLGNNAMLTWFWSIFHEKNILMSQSCSEMIREWTKTKRH